MGPFDDLTYLGTDGRIWHTKLKVHSGTFGQGALSCTFESYRDGGDGTNFEVVDAAGIRWRFAGVGFRKVNGEDGTQLWFQMDLFNPQPAPA